MKGDFRPIKVQAMRYSGFDSSGVEVTITLEDKSTFDLFVSNDGDYHLTHGKPGDGEEFEISDGNVHKERANES